MSRIQTRIKYGSLANKGALVLTIYAAIRNRVPLKDYKTKDKESVETMANIGEVLENIGE